MEAVTRRSFWIGFLALLGAIAHAAPSGDFCSAPFASVCGSDAEAAAISRARTEAGSRVEDDPRAQMAGVEQAAVAMTFRKIQSYLADAIDRRADFVDGLRLKVLLYSVEPFTYADQQALDAKGGDPTYSRSFSLGCGNGRVDGAFATRIKGKRVVVICPGLLAASLGRNQDPDQGFRRLLGVVAHEIAHHFDAKKLPDVYESYLSCVAERSGDRLFGSSQGLKKAAFDHRTEITADYWAAGAVARYFEVQGQRLSARAKTTLVRWIYDVVCGSYDEGVHPSDHFRIEETFARDPWVRQALGCEPEKMSGCDL